MDKITFQGKEYLVRETYHEGFGGNVLIGEEALEDALLVETSERNVYDYINQEAEDIDETIYGYLEKQCFDLDDEAFQEVVNEEFD